MRPSSKIHPMPIWKQYELARDPSFRDLAEQLKGVQLPTWSAKRGYKLSFKQEAAILKENTRAQQPQKPQQQQQEPQTQKQDQTCCSIM